MGTRGENFGDDEEDEGGYVHPFILVFLPRAHGTPVTGRVEGV